jgi:hypothetical protein
MTDDGHALAARVFVFGKKTTTQGRLDAQHLEVIVRNLGAPDPLRFTAFANMERDPVEGRKTLHTSRRSFQLFIQIRRER